MRIDAIKIVGRYRRDLGDISALAKSIAAVDLINPITVTSDGQLIAGQRRVEACKSLGWNEIRCIVADDLDSAAARLAAERDENTERQPMTPEELVRLGLALEELERPRADARAGSRTDLRASTSGSREPEVEANQSMETKNVVGRALGIGGTTYARAKAVVKAAQNEDLSPAEQEIAREALADMNTTGNVNGSYVKIREAGLTPLQRQAEKNGDAAGIRQRPILADAKKQRYVLTKATASLSGMAIGLSRIEDIHPQITSEEAAQWVGDLSEARRVIEALIKRLRKRIDA